MTQQISGSLSSLLVNLPTRVLKKKKLKINVHRPVGTRKKFDEEGIMIPPLAALGNIESNDSVLRPEKVKEWYERLRQEMSLRDKEDKVLHRQHLHEKRTREMLKRRREEEEEEDGYSEQDEEAENKAPKRSKIYFDSYDDDDEQDQKARKDVSPIADSISVAEQEALALKLLCSMHS